ncbi:MAG: transcription elongation factor GreA [Anaerolineae bacterium]|nr:transcription elongation factor GreA [Promineifilum sp.]MCZ2114430.1 transcription elongation factor GreA [Anaerolineae bacterium]HNS40205.1 transcription elongation factor GreA [Promineifilum sp.]
MVNDDVLYLTPEGLQQIKDELENIRTVRREEIAQKLEIAIKQGDLKENADYHDAKEEQGLLEARARQLEDMLRRAKVIEKKGPSNIVQVGSTVTVSEDGYDEMETYTIVGALEANPAQGKISNESPIGRALLGATKGSTVNASTPQGQIAFTIHDIS